MTDKPPDYTTMSGAEFQRAVGADPTKWAEAFAQRAAAMNELISDDLQDELVVWFRDFGAAAVRAQGQLLNWDQPDEHDPSR
jgi:hypothetical protein